MTETLSKHVSCGKSSLHSLFQVSVVRWNIFSSEVLVIVSGTFRTFFSEWTLRVAAPICKIDIANADWPETGYKRLNWKTLVKQDPNPVQAGSEN